MGLRWQDLVIPCTIGSLIEGGYLSQFVAYAPYVPDLTGVKTVAGDYAEDALASVATVMFEQTTWARRWLSSMHLQTPLQRLFSYAAKPLAVIAASLGTSVTPMPLSSSHR